MPKQHWTERFNMQIARQTVAQRAQGMLQRSGMLNDVEVIDARRIRVGMPDGFDSTNDPTGQGAEILRGDKIDAVAGVLRLRYIVEPARGDKCDSLIVTFLE